MPFVPFRAACALAAALAAFASPALATEPVAVLFVGNSFTFGRADPVMSYNNAKVTDLTRPQPGLPHPNFTSTSGANPWEPHPWGGVPGIFKQLADQAGLAYDVSLSTRNAASLRGHFLNTANADWDLRGNNTLRRIPANPNASAATKVYLTQTWARPDMVFPHLSTVPDANYPAVPDGRPIVDTTNPLFPDGFQDTLYHPLLGLAGMTADLHMAAYGRAAANPGFAGVAPVGDAFQRAVDQGVAKGSGFYDAAGVYAMPGCCEPMDLWWHDDLHASRYGSYLSALVLFGTATGLDPWNFGAGEKAAADLGISPGDAVTLQRIASEQLLAAGIALTRTPCPEGAAACGSAP